jgi:hypothetical protein
MWQSNAMLVTGAWALVGLVVLFAEWRAVRHLRRRQRESERALALLTKQTESAVAMSVRVGQRLRRAERLLAWACERVGQLELRNEGRSYDQAIELVRRGADAGRLMSNLGLSRGEAELVTLLHGQRKAG